MGGVVSGFNGFNLGIKSEFCHFQLFFFLGLSNFKFLNLKISNYTFQLVDLNLQDPHFDSLMQNLLLGSSVMLLVNLVVLVKF